MDTHCHIVKQHVWTKGTTEQYQLVGMIMVLEMH